MLADGGVAALTLLSRCSVTLPWRLKLANPRPFPYLQLLPEEPIRPAHPASDDWRHRMPNFMCARRKPNAAECWARMLPMGGPSSQRTSTDTRFQTCAFWSPRDLLFMCLAEVVLGCFACPLPRPCSPKSIGLRGLRRPGFWRTCIMDVGCSTAIP